MEKNFMRIFLHKQTEFSFAQTLVLCKLFTLFIQKIFHAPFAFNSKVKVLIVSNLFRRENFPNFLFLPSLWKFIVTNLIFTVDRKFSLHVLHD